MPRRLAVAALFLSLVAAMPHAARADDAPTNVELVWGVKVPMRDGVSLNATVYKPRSKADPQPVIFTLTPYIGDSYHDRAMYFASHGYVFALVDARGRGSSGGTFEPFANEPHDGYDVCEWLAKQPYCNGKVAMWGGSYAGYDQWATLKEAPPHLATIVPAAAAHAGYDFPFFQNVFSTYVIQWLTFTSGVTPNAKLFGDGKFWSEVFYEWYQSETPFAELDARAGNMTSVFQKWLQHPTPDAYWDAMAPTPDQYRKMNIPILTITGHYDGDQPGALHYYRQFMQYASPEARARHYLIIGPWDHAGTRTPNKEVGGLTFGDASVLDLNSLHKQWYDWTMKGGPKPEFLKKSVAYYVVGPEQWKYADSLESVSNATRTLYLGSADGKANDVFRSGTLGDAAGGGAATDTFVYDPLDKRPGTLEHDSSGDTGYLLDQTAVQNLFGTGVVYTSEPFSADTEVSGPISVSAWLSMDVPDTDLFASLYEVRKDGSCVQLTNDVKRARYRESLREAKLVPPGEIIEYRFDTFSWFSRRIAKDSRLRLVIGCTNSMSLEKNFNGGGVVANESGKNARTAHVTLYHDATHKSALLLPIVR